MYGGGELCLDVSAHGTDYWSPVYRKGYSVGGGGVTALIKSILKT